MSTPTSTRARAPLTPPRRRHPTQETSRSRRRATSASMSVSTPAPTSASASILTSTACRQLDQATMATRPPPVRTTPVRAAPAGTPGNPGTGNPGSGVVPPTGGLGTMQLVDVDAAVESLGVALDVPASDGSLIGLDLSDPPARNDDTRALITADADAPDVGLGHLDGLPSSDSGVGVVAPPTPPVGPAAPVDAGPADRTGQRRQRCQRHHRRTRPDHLVSTAGGRSGLGRCRRTDRLIGSAAPHRSAVAADDSPVIRPAADRRGTGPVGDIDRESVAPTLGACNSRSASSTPTWS